MGESLRGVAGLSPCLRVVLLSEQADVVAQRQQAVELRPGLGAPTGAGVVVHQPEAAGQKCRLSAAQAVNPVLFAGRTARTATRGVAGGVAVDQAVVLQLLLDRRHRGDHPLIRCRQEADQRHHQHRGVQLAAAVVLGEGSQLGIPGLLEHLGMDGVAQLSPALDRSIAAVLLHRPHRPVEGHPHHEPGVGEVPILAADLPQPLVRALPVRGEEVEQRQLDRPGEVVLGDAGLARLVQGVEHFAVDVELELLGRRVAHPDRSRSLVTGQPIQFVLGQLTLAGRAVDDLQVLRVTGDGPQQPRPPGLGFLAVAGDEQRPQRQRRVPQPAVAVVPVAVAAELLGQRGGHGRDDAAGGGVGQRLEGDQRANHRVPVGAFVGAPRCPLLPEPGGALDLPAGVVVVRNLLDRGEPHHRERQRLPGGDRELRQVPALVPFGQQVTP